MFAIFVVFTVPAAAQNEVYLFPHQSNATYCNTVEVQIWANATNFQSGQINLTYDPTCANVTNWARNTATFPLGGWTHYDGREWITFTAMAPMTGEYMIGTLTIHCVNDSAEGCETPLAFIEPSRLIDDLGVPVTATWTNGTFNCEPSQCLGTCCNDSECTDPFATDVTCKECITAKKYWKPNKDANCFNGPEHERLDLCLGNCPHCCDGEDNDYDGKTDFPADPECTCGLDPSEADPLPPIPEAPSIILVGIGLLALMLLMRWQRRGTLFFRYE